MLFWGGGGLYSNLATFTGYPSSQLHFIWGWRHITILLLSWPKMVDICKFMVDICKSADGQRFMRRIEDGV